MYVLFEESGSFKAGRIMSDSNGSLQVELPSGKRSKIKSSQTFFNFNQPEPEILLSQAESESQELDLDFLWECAPPTEFSFEQLATDYFSQPSVTQRTALLLRLHSAPMYFYRKGRGLYKPAPPDILQAAKQAIARKAEQSQRQNEYAAQMQSGELPAAIAQALPGLLFKPDKNSIEFKALEQACSATQQTPARLLLQLGGVPDAYALHFSRFLFECFPAGTAFPALPAQASDLGKSVLAQLPRASVQAFSIDDSSTTEIDDAFSVQALDLGADNGHRIGIHIAAPGLAITPNSPYDAIARARLSTVYMPGDKITMLPEILVDQFTLAAGRICPALSLYADIDASGNLLQTFTQVEAIQMVANLRHDLLDELVTETSLQTENVSAQAYPFQAELTTLWRFAVRLSAEREAIRGKPEQHNRVDYNYYVDYPEGVSLPGDPRTRVRIVARQRQAPLDRLVAELMIFANSTWGKLLAEQGLPGIYRAQQNYRTRMQTKPAPHEGLGVKQYAWSTSPLRRYVDLVNQWQLLSIAQSRPPPLQAGDADLFAVLNAFETAYTSYNDFQDQMERYWCLRWLAQQAGSTDTNPSSATLPLRQNAVVLKEDLVRLRQVPLHLRLAGLPETAGAGREIELDILGWDWIDLSVTARWVGLSQQTLPQAGLNQEEPTATLANTNHIPADNTSNLSLSQSAGKCS